MANYLLSGLVDSPTAYGFAVSTCRHEPGEPPILRRTENGDLTEISANDFTMVVRHYPATLESAIEHQPVVTPTIILAYEGRVDNREEIAYALGVPRLAQQPDGAVLAAAYDAWGPALSEKTIGEYAYVVFDRRTQQLVAGQDSLGVRRLFYSTIGERILITSNLRLLFQRFPDVRPPSYDRQVLGEYFAGTMTPWSGRTIWRGVWELGRGNVLVQRGNQLEQETVWQPDAERQERFKSPEEVDEVFRKHLFDGVRAALRSPGPLLCDISGGFDSSTVCSVASLLIQSGESHGALIGWSLVNKRSDESKFQDAVRQQFHIDTHHTLDLANYLPFQCFTDTEIPTGGFLQMGSLNRATRELAEPLGIGSQLTGQAADALFHKSGGGAPVYLADWFREGRFVDWSRHFLAYLRGGSFNAWQLMRECTVGTLDLHVGWHAPIPNWITPKFHNDIKQANYEYSYTRRRAFRSHARERVYRWTSCFVPYTGGGLPDERLPLVYRPLVEFILGLEWDYLVRPNEERLLMRRSLRGILPETVRSGRCRTAFGAVFHEGLRAAWPQICHFVTGEQLAELGVVELKPFQLAIDAMRAGYEGPNGQITRTALYLETWLGIKQLLKDNPAPVSVWPKHQYPPRLSMMSHHSVDE